MKRYEDITGTSGITAYEIKDESITIEFSRGSVYIYTYSSTGKRNIEKMKKLALAGKGLSTYISRNIKDKYETKIR